MNVSRAWLVAIIALVLGAIAGLGCDERPARPIARRGGFRVVEADLHVHTTYSDGTLSPLLVVRQAERRGLDVIAVTEHNTVLPSRIARAWSQWTGGPIVLTGEEITTSRHHVIGVGLEDTIAADLPVEGVVTEIHRQRGVAIAAHPVMRFQDGLAPARDAFDGVEIMHPIAWSARSPSWRWEDMLAWWRATEPRPAAIGSSDYHFASVLGLARTLVFVREPADEAAMLEALRARRTVVFDREGQPHGDPAMVAALENDPYVPRSSDYAYRGAGALDRALRLVGLFGVAGVAFLSARRRRQSTALKPDAGPSMLDA